MKNAITHSLMNLKGLKSVGPHLFIACVVLSVNLSCSSSLENRSVGGDDFPIVLAQTSDAPVSVLGLEFSESEGGRGDLQIRIKNVAGKPVRTAEYWLAPMPCRQSNQPSLIIDYDAAVLNPDQTATISVERGRLEEYLHPKKRPSIPCTSKPEERPHLLLAKVLFDDGAVWEIGKHHGSGDSL